MTRPTNPIQDTREGSYEHSYLWGRYLGFEEGVDAGREWGHEECRQRIEKLRMAHWPVSDYSTDPSGLAEWFVRELLGNWDID